MRRPSLTALGVAGALALAGVSGVFVARALGQAGEPTQTVTINVAEGARGPTGPPGPAGPAGPAGPQGPAGDPTNCGPGFSWSLVLFNTPGGQKRIKTCAANE